MSAPSIAPIKWEAAGTYRTACHAVQIMRDSPHLASGATHLLDGLRISHVVTIDREQVEALPVITHDTAEFQRLAGALRPPFPMTYLSLDNARMDLAEELFPLKRLELAGALMVDLETAPVAIPADSITFGTLWVCYPFFFNATGRMVVPPQIELGAEQAGIALPPSRVNLSQEAREFFKVGAEFALERVIAVLALLDGTVGVTLEPAAVSRQVRRNAERHNMRIALTVQIRSPRRRSTAASNGTVNYSHRFERRAHFACITKGPHYVEEKLATWCPKHGAHACRREYRRATIVGPPDKPFIPKIRTIKEQQHAD